MTDINNYKGLHFREYHKKIYKEKKRKMKKYDFIFRILVLSRWTDYNAVIK